ncbi:hypothetical protein FEM48_Zijuj03G0196200 [Ziziphus jujuba var. spinosa]|uniref:Uncharacterized protein n=1 Tax=Ziziphus jujuba var. spinosa TaxID=714518 RepID=A0A978VS82_ZIZJJ|nr:hypothetical protein FEM48_Zijuj03G0196200 [Ziziphus jujuba var. spinosa]
MRRMQRARFEPCFQCEQYSNFHLHEECARASPSRSAFHSFLKKGSLLFLERPGCCRYCEACGREMEGFQYQYSRDATRGLHPCCLKLQHSMVQDGVKLKLYNKLACLKDMLYRNWRSQLIHAAAAAASGENFNIHNAIMPRPHQSETIQDLVLFQGGLSHKLKQFWKKLVLVIKFMASSIFGNPTAGSSSIYEAMISIATTQLTNVAGTTSRYR